MPEWLKGTVLKTVILARVSEVRILPLPHFKNFSVLGDCCFNCYYAITMAKIEIVQVKNHKFLFLDDYLWMWDLPQEQELQRDIANQAFGDVLVAGYGFWIVTKYLLESTKVKSVTTVEKYQEVIDKIKEFGPIYGKIIIADFYELPENEKYDCVIGDIWTEIDQRFLDDYKKFKEKAKKFLKPSGFILGWGKDYFEFLLKKGSD